MYKAKLQTILEEDWTKKLTETFNTKIQTYYTSHLNKNTILDIIIINITQKNHQKIIKLLKKEPTINQIDKLESKQNHIILKIITKYQNENKQETNTSIILKNNCFIDSKIEMENGWETFSITSNKKTNITKTIKELQKTRKTKLISIKKIDFEKQDLTKKQYNTIKIAYENGFFNLPKKTSTKEIAKKINSNNSTTIAHIKKTENKIISNFFSK